MNKLAMLVLVLSQTAFAQVSGRLLLSRCEGRPDWGQGYCVGFVEGLTEAYVNTFQLIKPAFCLPDEVTSEQLMLVATKYLKDHPAKLHLDAKGLVFSAMVESFPCRTKENTK